MLGLKGMPTVSSIILTCTSVRHTKGVVSDKSATAKQVEGRTQTSMTCGPHKRTKIDTKIDFRVDQKSRTIRFVCNGSTSISRLLTLSCRGEKTSLVHRNPALCYCSFWLSDQNG